MSRDVLDSTLSDLRTAFDRLAEEIGAIFLITKQVKETQERLRPPPAKRS
jgi:hypothetical protein